MKNLLYLFVVYAIISAPSVISKNTDKIPTPCLRYIRDVVRESRTYGLEDNADLFMGQIEQESQCNEKVTAFDHGMGLAQFMPKTAAWIHEEYSKELLEITDIPNPYNPKWAIRAMILYDKYLLDRVKCKNDWHFTLRAYNGGLGNINKEIIKANSCDYDEVASFCLRSEFSCKVNIEYPTRIYKRSLKYNLYLSDLPSLY